MTFEAFRDLVLQNVRKVGDTFTRPDDDWIPMLFGVDAKDKFYLSSPQDFFDSVARKEIFAKIALPALVKAEDLRMAALLVSAWTVMIDGAGDKAAAEKEVRRLRRQGISDHPARREIVVVQCATLERHEDWWALIQRREDGPPLLSPWQERPEGETEGRMDHVVQGALRMAALLPTIQ